MTWKLFSFAVVAGALLAGSCLYSQAHRSADTGGAAAGSEPPVAHEEPAPVKTAVAAPAAEGSPQVARIAFADDVLPLLQGCRPCHFEGGKIYDRLPFDDPGTIVALGERLFTRIKEPAAQSLIRAFLAQEGE